MVHCAKAAATGLVQKYASGTVEVPLVIGAEEFSSAAVKEQPMPFKHVAKIARYSWATRVSLSPPLPFSRRVAPV